MFQLNVLLAVVLLSAVVFAAEEDVLVFTDNNFSSKVQQHDLILVEFYAPWCGHCKKLKPEYETAAEVLKENDPPVPLAKVDCTAETEVCKKYDVGGYPTLKIFRNGELEGDYQGPRSSDGIVSTMKSKAGPSSKPLDTEADYEKFLAKNEHAIVAFYDSEDSQLAKIFKQVADSLQEKYRFGHTSLVKEGFQNSLVLFYPKPMHNKFEPNFIKYKGELTGDMVKDWIKENFHGLCGYRKPSNSDQFDKKPLVIAYYKVDYEKNPKGTNYWRNRIMKVAKKFDGQNINFAISSSEEASFELNEYGDPKAGDKPLVVARGAADEKFVMSDEFSMDALEKFVSDLLAGKLDAYLKSEPVPEKDEGAVKVVVAKNFNEVVNDESKDVLIEFYAPWCGHCKELAPKYEELAEKLKSEPNVVIAKMDATANDVPSPYQVQGFPTLFFAPKGSKSSPRPYQGGRETKDFIEFLSREASDELKGYTRDGKKKKSEL